MNLGIIALIWALMGASMPAAAETLQDRVELLAPHFDVTRPEGDGPFPVLIMLHGCGGPRQFTDHTAEAAIRAGAAVINVDSYRPRRISRVAALATVCTGARLQGRERAGDLYAAMAWARQQSWVDGSRVAAIGWSHGAWTIMDALALRSGAEMRRATGLEDLPDEPLEGLSAALIVYPYTGIGSFAGRREWRLAPRSTAIIAQHDYIVGQTRGALERQRQRSPTLDLVLFEGATHAFEDAQASDPRVRYNPASTAREHGMIRDMIEAM
jgi:dienelactone hydrolase